MDDRICGTCRHFEWAAQAGRGWCRNPRLFTSSQSQPVSEDELACATRLGDYWEAGDELGVPVAVEPEPDIIRPVEYHEQRVPSGGDQMRGSSADQPRSSDDPLYESPEGTAPRGRRTPSGGERAPSSGGPGDRAPSYQADDRYWTDYLRIALPIAGLLLLLSVFWYWASSFIGADNDGTQTPVVAVNLTPDSEPTMTPTLVEAVSLETPTTGPATEPTQDAAPPTQAPAEPTQPPAEPTQPPAEPTQPPAEPTTEGGFAEGDLVIVNDNDVNMRAEPSTGGEVVDTLAFGTELRVLSGTPTQDDEYTWWNVSDDALGITGWVVEQYLEK
ncbi:MAG: SH3 domain-containing protein [Thermomicrobiales bacterium]|nr:SH3 domain-containing protein [Thermomicrobiales bacterium]MCO5222928.1 SH3 domain-containing protein [Thermomicrobiales bacterium]